MTVISCMRFNDKEGAMVADEQSSVMGGNFRKYDLATKVYTLVDKENEKLIIGGTGATNFLHEAYKQALSSRKPEYSAKDTLQLLSSIFIKLRRDIIDGSLISRFNCKEEDILRGTKYITDDKGEIRREEKLGELVKQKYQEMLEHLEQGVFNSSFLSLSYDTNSTIEINHVSASSRKPMMISQPYATTGTGADTADGILYNYFSLRDRNARDNIDPLDGLATLLYATALASARNIGVGGTPFISMIIDGKIITPNENNSRLAVEIVRAAKNGYLNQEFQKEALKNLVYNGTEFKEVEKEMWRASSDIEK